MRGVFEDKESDRGSAQRDTELTLSSGALLGIFFGLVLLCGLFFGLGFAVGHYGPPTSLLPATAAAQPSSPASASKVKPSAVPVQAPQRTAVSVPVAASDTASETSGGLAGDVDQDHAVANPSAQPAVRPALSATDFDTSAQPAAQSPDARSTVQPALPPASAGLMVQIAAVSHPEDAEVLLGALRKRGYAVSARRLPTDTLIHVQVGPFNTRDEAIRWRQRLLDDGYNAILQP
jgi:cell division protein FtsN